MKKKNLFLHQVSLRQINEQKFSILFQLLLHKRIKGTGNILNRNDLLLARLPSSNVTIELYASNETIDQDGL